MNNKTTLVSDRFESSKTRQGIWMQDFFGIVKNTLLSRENCGKRDMLLKAFNLMPNKTEQEAQEILELDKRSAELNFLYQLPRLKTSKGENVVVKDGDTIQLYPIEIFNEEFKKVSNVVEHISNQTHIKGGNYFITKGQNGEDEVLIGQNELKKYDIDTLKEMFGTDKIHLIPQADYHLDLFIRPLKDKKVLIADDNMMYKILTRSLDKLTDYVFTLPYGTRSQFVTCFINLWKQIDNFPKNMANNRYARIEKVESALQKAGYKTIPVPARLYQTIKEENANKTTSTILKHDLNYLNAHALINSKGELVYITNKSDIDSELGFTPEIIRKTGVSIEKAATDALKKHVDKLYFVSGDNNAVSRELLSELYGGIHCSGMEVPV
jgi:hypothetical protein